MTEDSAQAVGPAMRYHATVGGALTESEAQQVGPLLHRIVQELPEEQQRGAVVDAGRPEDSPLHPYFEWNDYLAGERYRRMQAGALIKSVSVEIVNPDGRDRHRSLSAPVTIGPARQREPSVDGRHLVPAVDPLAVARAELLAWRERWGRVDNDALRLTFRPVFQAIETVMAPRTAKRCVECRTVLPDGWGRVRCEGCAIRPAS